MERISNDQIKGWCLTIPHRYLLRGFAGWLFAFHFVVCCVGPVWAENPAFPESQRVFPDTTVAWISIADPEDFGAIAKPVLEAETRTWYNAMGTKPKREHLRSMDMLVKRLKWTNIWNELDTLYVFAAQNKSDSLINVRNPTGIATLTEASTAGFTTARGWTAGNNGRLDLTSMN